MFRLLLMGWVVGSLFMSGMAQGTPPNFLLITGDDLNFNSVGAFGSTVDDITPNLDQLAAEGMRFENGHVTIAVCQPSREVLMTGRYPHNNGAPGFDPIADSVPTLQEQLCAAGYYNGILGKARHLRPTERFCWDDIHDGVTTNDFQDELGLGRAPELYYQFAKAFFQQAKQAQKPFFLMANSHDPHRPFAGSAQEAKKWPNVVIPVSRTYTPAEINIPGFLPNIPEVKTEMAQYFTSVHRMDETVGRILDALQEEGYKDNTVVMFLSDNGMALPFAKTNTYLNSTKTPWIVRWPGTITPGGVDSTHFISGIDFMPTVLEAAGLPSVPNVNGNSFLSLLNGESQIARTYVVTEFNTTSGKRPFPMRAIQNEQYGYIYNKWSDGATAFKNESQNGLTWDAMVAAGATDADIQARVDMFSFRVPEEFYDYEKDPNGLNNLIDDPAYQNIINEMRQQLANNLYLTQDSVLADLENETGVKGNATEGCMDFQDENYNSLAVVSDNSCKGLFVKKVFYSNGDWILERKGTKLNVSFSGIQPLKVELIDMQGKVQQTGSLVGNAFQISVEGLNSGVWILKASVEGGNTQGPNFYHKLIL